MRSPGEKTRHVTTPGFTLIELLVATVIISILVVALSAVVMTAFGLRSDTQDVLEQTLIRDAVADLLKRDLELMVAPIGIIAGAVLGEREEAAGGLRTDCLEFYSASGALLQEEPWGSVQRTAYYLSDEDAVSGVASHDLIRAVTRNLLPLTEEQPEEVAILHDVQSLTFAYYDGETWQDSWDSTLYDDEAPEAVHVRIETVSDKDGRSTGPIELVCEVASRGASTSEDAGGDSP